MRRFATSASGETDRGSGRMDSRQRPPARAPAALGYPRGPLMRLPALPILLVATLATACGGEDTPPSADAGLDCSQDPRGEVFTAGMTKGGGAGYGVRLDDALPSPPAKGDNAWTVRVLLGGAGPVSSDEVQLVPRLCMPDHNHGTSVTP